MKKLFCTAFLLVVGISHAQIKLEGVVRDSLNQPLELANVIAINQETSGLESFGVTSEQGRFRLDLGKNGTYKIQISYVGMQTFEEILTTREADITKDYKLKPAIALEGVELIYEMPVTVQGDTVVYNADSYKSGT